MIQNRTKLSLALLLLHNVQMLFWGLLLACLPGQVLGTSSIAYLGRTWFELKGLDGQYTTFVELYMRFWGVQGLLMAVIFTFIAFKSYVQHEKWAWLAVLICSTIGWCSAVALDIKLKVPSIIWFDLLPLVFAYASLLLLRKDVFSRRVAHQENIG